MTPQHIEHVDKRTYHTFSYQTWSWDKATGQDNRKARVHDTNKCGYSSGAEGTWWIKWWFLWGIVCDCLWCLHWETKWWHIVWLLHYQLVKDLVHPKVSKSDVLNRCSKILTKHKYVTDWEMERWMNATEESNLMVIFSNRPWPGNPELEVGKRIRETLQVLLWWYNPIFNLKPKFERSSNSLFPWQQQKQENTEFIEAAEKHLNAKGQSLYKVWGHCICCCCCHYLKNTGNESVYHLKDI